MHDAAAPAGIPKSEAASASANNSQAVTASDHAAPASPQAQPTDVKHVSAAAPAPPPQEPTPQGHLQREASPNIAVPSPQTPKQAPVKIVQNKERKLRILFDKADRITMNFTMNQKIAYSN